MKKTTKRRLTRMLCIILLSSICVLNVFAEEFVPKNSSDSEIMYLYSSKENISEEILGNKNVCINSLNSVKALDIINAKYIVVEFQDMKEDSNLAEYVSDVIKSGKIVFIRAEAHTANVSLLKHLLKCSGVENGELYEKSSSSLMERINTFGYVLYIDANQRLQVIRQRADFVTMATEFGDFSDSVQGEKENITSERAHLLINSRKPSVDQEIDAINDFLSYNSPANTYNFTEQNEELDVQSFDVGSNYEIIYDTVNYYAEENLEAAGSITRRICAARVYPETTVKVGTPYPVATGETKWVFQSVINMSPRWNDNKYSSAEMLTSFSTYPVGQGNATYKNIIADYQPKIDTSGKTQVTYSIGGEFSWGKEGPEVGISGGVSWMKSYEDITFTVDYVSGAATEMNYAMWNYTIGNGADNNFDVWFPKDIQKTTVELVSAVRVNNIGNTTVGVQLNTKPTFAKKTSVLAGTKYVASTLSVVYILPVR